MEHLTTTPHLSFAAPEFYGDGISVKQMLLPESTTPFKSTYFEILPGFTSPVDRHKVEECWLVLQGSGILDVDGEQVAISEHDVVHFDSFKGHSVTNNSTKSLLICSIYW
ncbi:MAG: cupin domain-containing protein [Candidatus Obscuribacterales bacterium]|nr:cupin domain-containing protein [Candidatus Obscuribacterales bacterium]